MSWRVRFPLTPALSPSEGERESPRSPFGEAKAVGLDERRGAFPPLPWGEGRGEGKRRARTSSALVYTVALLASASGAAEPPKAPVPKSPHLSVVYRYADTMLEKGHDTSGPQKTGLFLSALDRATLAPFTNRPPAPAGVREGDRVGPKDGPLTGANPQHDENLLRLLYLLSDLSAKPKYREAADAALKSFIENSNLVAPEPFRPWLLWDRCFELAPDASKRAVVRLTTGEFAKGATAPREGGFTIRALSSAYARTKDEQFTRAIVRWLDLYETKRLPAVTPSLAIDCDGAAHGVPAPLAAQLRAVAEQQDSLFCSLRNRETSPQWTGSHSTLTTAQAGMMCVSRYDNSGRIAYRNLLLAAADSYLDSLPAEGEDVWPGTFGHAISLQVAAWRHTAKPEYLERARKFSDIAVERYWGTNALPRASLKSEHYESITGADTLALSLVDLHLQILAITAVRCPPNTIDR